MGLTYKDSGVDVQAGNSFVKKIAPVVKKTFTNRVITGIGGFGALYSGSFPEMKDPVLVSGTDGVGTKLQIARKMNKHDTIGIDAVAMCVNDIIVSGAAPLFFLDYISCGKLNEDILVDVIRGIAEGCTIAGCSLIGGETAEHPEIMPEDEYDIAGFAVGVVDRPDIIDGSGISADDVIIGLPSSGIHSNGYSLVRKLFFSIKNYDLDKTYGDLDKPLGETLLEPTRIYARALLSCLKDKIPVKGVVHITGGGFHENIPRILPENSSAVIEKKSFDIPPVFRLIQHDGKIDEKEMFTTFNMGMGMILFTDKNSADRLANKLADEGEPPVIIGEVKKSSGDRVQLV